MVRRSTDEAMGEVILSEDAYHRRVISNGHWANRLQDRLLSTHTCLLIGLSLRDPHLRLLLDKTKRNRKRFILITPGDVRPHKVPRPELNTTNRRYLARVRENYGESFALSAIDEAIRDLGVQCVWLDKHSARPLYLDRLSEAVAPDL
jgi:hypothetical protein